ncbi:MAG: YhbD family protein [Coriobacteriia bacterium]|nr:YhbD family protein [Coriobacteriia bacterium]
MDNELISKKDLLIAAGISYGQLYRWKRKGLIPEDWFIRKATFTGQETFLPRERVLARIERIKSMKDEDISLDDIADAVAPDLGTVAVSRADAATRGLASGAALVAIGEVFPGEGDLRVGELLAAMVHDRLLEAGDASLDEAQTVVRVLEEAYAGFEGRECDLIFVRKFGVATCCLVSTGADVMFESGARVVVRLSLRDCIDELSARLSEGRGENDE